MYKGSGSTIERAAQFQLRWDRRMSTVCQVVCLCFLAFPGACTGACASAGDAAWLCLVMALTVFAPVLVFTGSAWCWC